MYWIDGSPRPPIVPHCFLLSSSRAKEFALVLDLIENQGRIVESCVKMNNFDHWCIEASVLVDLMIDLMQLDQGYLIQDGLSTRDKSLCQIADQNSQFVSLVTISTFELARKRLSSPSRANGRASTISTPIVSHTIYLVSKDRRQRPPLS